MLGLMIQISRGEKVTVQHVMQEYTKFKNLIKCNNSNNAINVVLIHNYFMSASSA